MRKKTIEELNKTLLEKYPQDNIHFIKYQDMKSECQIECDNCHTIYTFKRAEGVFKRKEYFCHKCKDTPEWKKQKEYFIQWLSNQNDFTLVDNLDNIHSSQAHVKCKCNKCGLVQQNKSVYDYYNGKQCFCQTKSIKKPIEVLNKELEENGYELLEEYINTDVPTLVKRKICGHQFKARVQAILSDKYYCPLCHLSKGEERIFNYLKENSIELIIRQYKIYTYKKCFIDFFLPTYNLFIEYNGVQHYKEISHFGGQEKFIEQQKRDNSIKEYCKNNNIELLEISYKDFDNIEKILDGVIMSARKQSGD